MTLHVKESGAWKLVNGLWVKDAGAWKEVQFAYVKEGGLWKEFYANEVVVTLANSNNINIQSLFSPADWASNKKKRVIIPAGVTIGSTSVATPALRSGTGWGRLLRVENYGQILGAGGAANGGVGGDAFNAEAAGIELLNDGAIKGGGGGGGKGGNGGAGIYSATVTEGPIYSGSEPWSWWALVSDAYENLWWGGSIIYDGGAGIPQPYHYGGWRYYKGSYVGVFGSADCWQIYRQQEQNFASSGGAGGNGGRGQGYDGAAASGSAGAAGGTNAGTGGTGGAGGAFGNSGSTGATGTAGNNGSGAAGSAGGLAGYGIKNFGNVILSGTGTRLGR